MNPTELTPRLRRYFDDALRQGKTLFILRHVQDGHLLLQHGDADNPGKVAGSMPPGYRIAFLVRPLTIPSQMAQKRKEGLLKALGNIFKKIRNIKL